MVINICRSLIQESLCFLKKNWMRFVLAVLFQIFMAVSLIKEAILIEKTFDLGHIWFQSFCGCLEFKAIHSDKFILPVLWLVFQAYILYVVCDYFSDNCRGLGIQRLLRINNRKRWFVQITGASICAIIVYYILYFLILCITMFVFRLPVFFIEGTGTEVFRYILTCFILPPMVTCTIFLIQNTVSIFINNFIGFIAALVILTVSSYWKNSLLIANYAMFLRNDYYRKEGLNSYVGIMICLCISVVMLGAGLSKISHADIIGKGIDEK